jgi:hypothetical protein
MAETQSCALPESLLSLMREGRGELKHAVCNIPQVELLSLFLFAQVCLNCFLQSQLHIAAQSVCSAESCL